MTPDTPSSQSELRRELLAQRRQLDSKDIQDKSSAITERLAHSDAFKRAETIGLYLPVRGEVDARPLLRLALHQGKRIALPKVSGQSMNFHPYHEGQHSRGAFGIDEPLDAAIIPIETIDLLCLPLVAFDSKGHRIGMGGGYYDRALALFKNKPSPLRIGLAYEFQKADKIESNEWDIPLHAIVTEADLHIIDPHLF